MSLCPTCGKRERDKRSAYCGPCHNAYMREYRESNRGSSITAKDLARFISNKCLNSGFIIKQPCEICGDEKSEMHHRNYSDPLNVNWYCKKHHSLMHKNIKGDFDITPKKVKDSENRKSKLVIFLDKKDIFEFKCLSYQMGKSMSDVVRDYVLELLHAKNESK